MNIHNVANFFLSCCNEKTGDLISNLKLQKLVYYAQGYHLAIFDEPLFNTEIQAWQYGPVAPSLYHYYKKYGNDALPICVDFDREKYPSRTVLLLDEIYKEYGQYSAWKLMDMTHNEKPWKDIYCTGENRIIDTSVMKLFFKENNKLNSSTFNFNLKRMEEAVASETIFLPEKVNKIDDIQKWLEGSY